MKQKRMKVGPNKIVSAEQARVHIQDLVDRKVPVSAIATKSKVRANTIREILSGGKKRIRKWNADALLRIDESCVAFRMVPAGRTWQLIRIMLDHGISQAELAKHLGYKTRQIQLRRDYILTRNARKVEDLYNRLILGLPVMVSKHETDPAETICEACANDDGESRDCGHVICEKCYSGECPLCDEEGVGNE
jgi:hypothetical protein